MRVLFTGAAGFIGSAVCDLLLRQGHEVAGVDNLSDAYDPRLKEWRLAQLRGRGGFSFTRADVGDGEAMARVFANAAPEVVANLAARAGVRQSLEDPQAYLDANARGTLVLLELCRKLDVPRFLLASTSSLYGAHNPRPFREDANTDRPLSPYAASKKAAEAMAAAYAHLYGLHAPVLRYFTVYGPAGRPDMSVFRFVRWIAEGEPVRLFGDGNQERDFTYVEDIARGTVAAINVEGFEIINLGSDQPRRIAELIALIERHTGRKACIERRPVHRADLPATWASIEKAKTLLGWKPKVSLEEGVRRTVEWYRGNRALASSIELRAEA